MEQVEMSIKTEAEMAATFVVQTDSEINVKFFKQNPELLQSVKSEPSFTNDALVKEEMLEDSIQDDSEQHCAEGLSTADGAGSLYEANDPSHGDCLSVKQELEDIDIGPTVLQHMDIHYALNKKTVDYFNKAMRYSGVNKSVEDKLRGYKIKCDYCGQTTTDYDEAHLKSCLGQQEGLQQHLLRQQPPSSSSCFRCDACGKTFRKPHLLSAHRKLHERYSATSCATNSSVAGPSNVRRNEAAKTDPKPFKCDICDKGYSSEGNLSAHKRFHSGVGLSVCHICSTKFNSKSNLTIHLRTHTGEKPYQCDTCNARFTTSGQLTMHKRVHTGEKSYQCDICNARFTTSGELTAHKRVHTGERPYQCDTCNARFAQSVNLTTHKRVHTGEKPYQCDVCDARFANSCNLTAHKRIHTGERPYQCNTCNAWFTRSGDLTTHKIVHTGEKPYQCDTCNARFARNCDLTKHKRVHTGQKPFECTECGSKFTENGNLNKHVRRRHRKLELKTPALRS